MNDQPKPAGEWTADTVRRIEFINSDQRYDAIADAHNAAISAANEDTEKYRSNCLYWKEQLAAEQEKSRRWQEVHDLALRREEQLREQLAAEREALRWEKQEHAKAWEQLAAEYCKDALAKAGEAK